MSIFSVRQKFMKKAFAPVAAVVVALPLVFTSANDALALPILTIEGTDSLGDAFTFSALLDPSTLDLNTGPLASFFSGAVSEFSYDGIFCATLTSSLFGANNQISGIVDTAIIEVEGCSYDLTFTYSEATGNSALTTDDFLTVLDTFDLNAPSYTLQLPSGNALGVPLDGGTITSTFLTDGTTVQTVPTPGAFVLFATGLAGFIGLRRRDRKIASASFS